ncbi:MAG: hypothetical protein Q8P15_00165 [Nanoarchaeota archaeon]|nr:hypothetical protein [Nanoarchaeota archaeon]
MTKTFEQLLKEHGYEHGNNEESFQRLEQSIKAYLEIQKAMWYADIIMKKDVYVEVPAEVSEKRIKIRRIPDQRKITSNTVRNLANRQNSFKINNIGQLLRDYHQLREEDVLEINPPTYLFESGNLDEMIRKTSDLYHKYHILRKNIPMWAYGIGGKNKINHPLKYILNLERTTQDNLKKINEFKEEIRMMEWKKKIIEENMAKDYFELSSRLPIAYLNPQDAITFFERETGIKLNNPVKKEYKYTKLVF